MNELDVMITVECEYCKEPLQRPKDQPWITFHRGCFGLHSKQKEQDLREEIERLKTKNADLTERLLESECGKSKLYEELRTHENAKFSQINVKSEE